MQEISTNHVEPGFRVVVNDGDASQSRPNHRDSKAMHRTRSQKLNPSQLFLTPRGRRPHCWDVGDIPTRTFPYTASVPVASSMQGLGRVPDTYDQDMETRLKSNNCLARKLGF